MSLEWERSKAVCQGCGTPVGEEAGGSRSALLLWEVWQREKERTVEKQLGSSRSSFAKEKPVCLCRQKRGEGEPDPHPPPPFR